MVRRRISSSRRSFVAGTAAAAIAPFFIGRAKADEPEFTIKLATVAPAGTPWHDDLKRFKKELSEQSGGRIKVKAYFGGGLGDENATADATKRGTIQCFGGSIGALASAAPDLECIELPYLFPTEKIADKILDEVVRDDLDKLLWDAGYKLCFYSENGYRSIGSTFEIKAIKDLKGRKMRVQESPSHINTMKAFGAAPVPISVTEVLSALQTGVVDGFDNTPLFAFAASWYQGIKYFTLTKHIYQPGVVVFSRKFWETLPADLQAIIMADPQKMAKRSRRGVRAMGGQLVENFRTAGVTVNELSATERATFESTAAVAYAKFLERASPAGTALLKKIQAAV
ncbi:MAG TPA: TRAP transporter substrate-binding protein [Nannocystaceae bacterium]|nr:TRAP transporter substrate-binding protein [Nannocystaceae bacterium]